jgi:hypothetical protein
VYKPDKVKEAEKVFGSNDQSHPGVHHLHNEAKEYYVGGKLQAINRLNHYDYIENRCTSPSSNLTKLLQLNSAHISKNSIGPELWLSKPAIQCTVPIGSSPSEQRDPARRTSSSTPSSVSPNQGISTITPVSASTKPSCLVIRMGWQCYLFSPSQCGWVVRVKQCGMPSSARTMVRRISSWVVIMQDLGRVAKESTFMDPMMRNIWSNSIKMNWGLKSFRFR